MTIFKDGALDVKTKELISTTTAALMRCEFCVKIHSERAKEIAEALSVAMFIAAGSQLHWTEVFEDIMKR